MRPSGSLPVLLLLLASTASASTDRSVGAEVSIGRVDGPKPAEATQAPAPSTYLGFGLNGDVELIDDRLNLDLAFGSLRDEGSSLSYQGSLGLELSAFEHWIFTLLGSVVPEHASDYTGTTSLTVPKLGKTLVPTSFKTNVWSGGLALSAGYETFGESDFEGGFDLTAGWTRYGIAEELVFPAAWSQRIAQAGKDPTPTIDAVLNQLKLGAGVTVVLFRDTDVALHFAWYAYDKKPDEVGYGRALRSGRITAASGTGLPVAPLKWDVRPMVAYRFSRWLSASIQGGAGRYFEDGTYVSGGLKVAAKPVPSLKITLSLTLQRDVDPTSSDAMLSRYLTLGASWRF